MSSTSPLLHRSKLELTIENLRGVVRRLGPGAKFPSTRELRVQLGISFTSVDLALNALEKEGLIERRERIGVFVAEDVTRVRTVAMVAQPTLLQQQNSPVWLQLMEAARRRAAIGHEEFSFHLVQPNGASAEESVPQELRDALLAGKIQGIISIGLPTREADWLQSWDVPVVGLFNSGQLGVSIDKRAMVYQGVESLAKRGCRSVALWQVLWPVEAGQQPPTLTYERVFAEAATRFGLEVCESWTWPNHDADFVSDGLPVSGQQQGFEVVNRLFSAPGPRPDGLMIFDDLLTHGALVAWRKMGLEPGRDFHLVSHSNRHSPILMGEDAFVKLEIDPDALIEAVFGGLEKLMDGQTLPSRHHLIVPRVLNEAPTSDFSQDN